LDEIFSELEFHFDSTTFRTTLSIGVATYPIHAKTANEMLQFADKALYFVKNKRRLENTQKSAEKKDPYREEAESKKKD
jgi:GGDEF domain-containing protein